MTMTIGKRGQGSFLSGDIPSIIMIVISMTFFLSSIYLAMSDFESKKADLSMRAALVDAASTFLKENAKVKPADLGPGSEYWTLRLDKIRSTYGVEVYIELECIGNVPDCVRATAGKAPSSTAEVLSRRFPVALQIGGTDLDVYAGLVRVSVYKE